MLNIKHQDDHLILPYSTLKYFMDEGKEINVLNFDNLNDVCLMQRRPKSYHTEKDYYIPEYDCEVKKRETLIGRLRAKILKAIEDIENGAAPSGQFDRDELKRQIIDISTIEFHRCVIVDDKKLQKYCEQQQKENNEVDKNLFRNGNLTKERCEYSMNYREKAKSLDTFRSYAQNILGTRNDVISETYKDFEAFILYVPKGADYSFWLPPFHFIGNEAFLIFVLSPSIALALYPPNIIASLNVKFDYYIEADKNKVDVINSRGFESVETMPNGFKELIGAKADMENLKVFFEQLRDHAMVINTSVILSGIKGFLKNDVSVFRTVIALHLLYGNTDKGMNLIIEPEVFERGYLKADKNCRIAEDFRKYGFDLI